MALVAFAAYGGEARFRLRSHQWKHRVLLVFAPASYNAAYLRQRLQFDKAPQGFRDRELLYVPVVDGETLQVRTQNLDAESQKALREEFSIPSDSFAVLLIGKDGGVKLRRAEPVTADELFRLIDSMPMRQQEMRRPATERHVN